MDANEKPFGRSRFFSVAMIVGASMPFLISLVFHAIGPAAQRPKQTADRPALVFDQYLVDLQHVPSRDKHFAHFSFTNRGQNTVTIKAIKTSCGCLQPHLEKRVYRPNESGDFDLRVATPNQEPGPKEYFLKVQYEDPNPREVELTFKLVLPQRQVVVRPRALIFYQLVTRSTTREIVVTDYREKQLAITGVTHASDLVSTEIGTVDENEFGHRRLRVAVTVSATVPSGRNHVLITIHTDDLEYAKLQIPLIIQGPDEKLQTAAKRDRLQAN